MGNPIPRSGFDVKYTFSNYVTVKHAKSVDGSDEEPL
jgi:hypothetical protein